MIRATVVIPTRDRCVLLRRCLQSLAAQSMPTASFEVIVVDNGSRDATPDVAREFAGHLNLQYIQAPELGLHVGRHAGFRAARSDVLMYGDDDIEAKPTWIAAVVDAFVDPAVGLVGGNNYPNFERDPPDWLRLLWERRMYKGRALGYLSVLDFGAGRFDLDPHYVWGCNFCVRRSVLEQTGGFHPDSLPKESILLRGDGETHVAKSVARKGWKVLFDSAASVNHFVPAARMTFEYFAQRAFAQGISDSYSMIRDERGLTIPFHRQMRSKVRPIVTVARELLRAASALGDGAHRKVFAVQLAMVRAWYAGFSQHQAAVRKDSHLLQWVLRESYLS